MRKDGASKEKMFRLNSAEQSVNTKFDWSRTLSPLPTLETTKKKRKTPQKVKILMEKWTKLPSVSPNQDLKKQWESMSSSLKDTKSPASFSAPTTKKPKRAELIYSQVTHTLAPKWNLFPTNFSKESMDFYNKNVKLPMNCCRISEIIASMLNNHSTSTGSRILNQFCDRWFVIILINLFKIKRKNHFLLRWPSAASTILLFSDKSCSTYAYFRML